MCSRHDDANGAVKVFEIDFDEHRTGQTRLFATVFKDRCSKCGLPSYVEIESPPEVESFRLSQAIGLGCGFWLAQKRVAELLCAEFEDQFEIKRISDDAYFLILKNILIPEDPDYKDSGEALFRGQEPICSLCGRPYVLLQQGFKKFRGNNRIKPRTIYETSLKFGSADIKYPCYYCDEEAACTLRKISRRFHFMESAVKFSVDAP